MVLRTVNLTHSLLYSHRTRCRYRIHFRERSSSSSSLILLDVDNSVLLVRWIMCGGKLRFPLCPIHSQNSLFCCSVCALKASVSREPLDRFSRLLDERTRGHVIYHPRPPRLHRTAPSRSSASISFSELFSVRSRFACISATAAPILTVGGPIESPPRD